MGIMLWMLRFSVASQELIELLGSALNKITPAIRHNLLLIFCAISGGLLLSIFLILFSKHNSLIAVLWCVFYLFGGGIGIVPRSKIGKAVAASVFIGTLLPFLGWVVKIVR